MQRARLAPALTLLTLGCGGDPDTTSFQGPVSTTSGGPSSFGDSTTGTPTTGDATASTSSSSSTGQPTTTEVRMAAPAAGERMAWVAWEHRLERTASDGPLIHSVGRDVTQRRMAEQALLASEEFLRRTGAWEFRCRTAGQAAEGMMCGGGTGCQRGLACVNDNGMATCKEYCQVDGDCTNPLTCTGMVPEPPFMFCDQ